MRILTRASVFAVTVLATVALTVPAQACTGVIVGKDLTEDGSFIFGRTEDLEQNHAKRLIVHEAGKHPKDSTITGNLTGVKHKQEKDSLKFTSVSDVNPLYGDFDEAGFNSAGVAVDATVSATASKEILDQDPYTENGWEESIITKVLLANATTAREGVELMASLVDKDGMNEGDILVIADQNEVWYMELYTGHQYAAMKYPSDAYSVFPNAFWLNHVDCADTANFICSTDLEQKAHDAGTYAETNGKFDVAKSYNIKGITVGSNGHRAWSGLKVLDPGNPATYEAAEDIPLLNYPSAEFEKVTPAKIMELQRNRFQGVDDELASLSEKVARDRSFLDANEQEVIGARYPIGNTNTMEAHFFQLPKAGMPAEVPGTLWQTIGNPQGSPYLPYYGNITDTIAPMQATSQSKMNDVAEGFIPNPLFPYLDDPNSYYWVATGVNLAVERDRATLTEPVLKYLKEIETPQELSRKDKDAELAAQYAADPAKAAKWATDEFKTLSQNSFEALQLLKKSLAVYNVEHDLVDGDNSLTVAPGQVIIPTRFVANDNTGDYTEYDGKEVMQLWDLKLFEVWPFRDHREIQPSQPVTVNLKLNAQALKNIAGAKLLHLSGGGATEVSYSVNKGVLSFKADSFSEYVLLKSPTTPPKPSADDGGKTNTGKATAGKGSKATPALSKTGSSANWLAGLAGILMISGGVALWARRRS